MRKLNIVFLLALCVLGTMIKCFAQQDSDFSQVIIVPNTPGVYSLEGSTLQLSAPVDSPSLYHHNTTLNNYSESNNNANASNVNTQDQTDQSNNNEYSNNMNQICADYYKNRASSNFTTAPNYVTQRQIVDRQVMSFSHFAQSCESYYNNNRLIQNGLNSEQQ